MLAVPQHPVERAKFPGVDVHTHPTFRARSVSGQVKSQSFEERSPRAISL
jgi:hypothetical protein